MENMINFLQGWSNGAITIRLILAALFGSLIGWERIARRHNAGIRTFALVSLGAAVATVLNVKL